MLEEDPPRARKTPAGLSRGNNTKKMVKTERAEEKNPGHEDRCSHRRFYPKITPPMPRDSDGRQRQRSTKVAAVGVNARREAQRIADAFEAMGRGTRTARQIQRVAADLIRDIYKKQAVVFTTRGWFDRWLATKEAITSEMTMIRYRGQADRFLAHLGEKADGRLMDIEQADLQGYRDARIAQVATKTVRHDLAFVSRVLRAAVHDGVLVESPADGLEKPKMTAAKQTRRRPFTEEELRRLMAVADPEWRSMIVFALYSGQRLGDIARLTWRNIDTAVGVIRLTTQKTGSELEIPIANPLQAHIAQLPVPDDPAAPLHPRALALIDHRGTVASLSAAFSRILEAAGLVEKKPHRKTEGGQGPGGRHQMSSLTFHSLRHTSTSWMKTAGINSDIVMQVVGHQSESISRQYTHAQLKDMKDAVNTMPDITTGGEK